MRLYLCGVRGSAPAPGAEFLRYGGHTSCVALAHDHLPDHCPTALRPGPQGWGEYHRDALDLASDVDLLLHDAFLLPEEVAAEASFGHAAADYAISLGQRAGARRVMLTHHKPGRTDDALDQLASRVAAGPAGVIVAAEGEILEL